MRIQEELFAMQDAEYKVFQSRLIPNIPDNRIIGIRIPILRKYAKRLKNSEEAAVFLQHLPHFYYEENNVHAFLIEEIRDFNRCIEELERFLPYVDNWATCDTMSPKILKKEKKKLLLKASEWVHSEAEYTVRYGIKVLMDYFLEEDFEEAYLYWVAEILREEYYIRMMQSWYMATALAKQYDTAVKLLEKDILDIWVHNKTIQKSIESRRISESQKAYLRTLKR